MKTLAILSTLGVAALLSTPTATAAQVYPCNGSCNETMCPDGHHRDLSFPKTWSLPFRHPHPDCWPAPCLPMHEGLCEGAVLAVSDEPVPAKEDLVLLADHESLKGEQLLGVIRRSRGLVYYNSKRGAIQRLDCADRSRVVMHLPLTPEQQSGFFTALAAAETLENSPGHPVVASPLQ